VNVIETSGLSKRYGRTWALRECTVEVPARHVAALVGPNGKDLPAADLLHLTRNLTRSFDQRYAETRLSELGIPLRRKAGKLSGGQQAQLALTLALARRPRLLVLDEPVAMLDPVARHDFMAVVLAAAGDGVSVLLSSHVLSELERMASYLVLLSRGQVRMAGKVDDLLAGEGLATLEELALTYLRETPAEVTR
jgi:ABC-2 type transport system ATP-binding protein